MTKAAARADERVSILVVDDHPENVAALRGVLARADYEIVSAASGPEALRSILHHDFAVILLDVLMPGMDGFQTARLIRERDRSRGIPILFLTASGSDLAMIDRAYSVGAVDYLVKPLDADAVRAKVSVFVDLHRKARLIQRMRVTERQRSEDELRDRDAEYQATFEGAPAGIAQLTPAGRLLRANPRFCQLFGSTWAALDGKPFAGLFHPDDAEAASASLERLLAGDADTDHRVQRCLREGGGLLWVDRRVSLLRDAAGKPSRFIVVLDDLTDRLRAEESERLLARAGEVLLSSLDVRAALDTVAQLAVPTLAAGCAIALASEAEGGPLELVGLAGDAATAHRDELASLCKALLPLRIDGAVALPLQARGHGLGTLLLFPGPHQKFEARERAVALDLVQRAAFAIDNARLYRSAQEAIRLRDEFLSIASHELRTPLTPLQLTLQRLCAGKDQREKAPLPPEKVRAALHAAERQVKRLSALVDNLLDVSRITSGRLELHREQMELGELAAEVVDRFEEAAAHTGTAVSLSRTGAVHGSWDRLRLEQVLTNLLSNAIKYGEGRPVDVVVEERPGSAFVEVRDHGIGIAAGELERIFGRFERAVSSRNYGGLGLGLYITRQIVDAHGGHVGARSEPAGGSVFSVELPR